MIKNPTYLPTYLPSFNPPM